MSRHRSKERRKEIKVSPVMCGVPCVAVKLSGAVCLAQPTSPTPDYVGGVKGGGGTSDDVL